MKQGEESPSSEGNRFVFSVRSSLGTDQLVWGRLWHPAVFPQDFGHSYGLEVHRQTRQDLIRTPKLKKIICLFSLNVADTL